MKDDDAQKDWTQGATQILFQSCGACRHTWYFRRSFCPSCGAVGTELKAAKGKGAVYAATIVLRAASPETKSYAPYSILLVDMDEGFRMMAHGDSGLVIGDKVAAHFKPFANGVLAPHFVKA